MYKSRRIGAIVTACAVAFAFSISPAQAASTTITKDETVFIVTDSAGSEKEVVVSDHLQNGPKVDSIVDSSDLKDIENVKGNETFKKGKGNEIVWNAKGNDIFYEGNSDRQTPVVLDITYKLNGKEITGEKLKDKSGDVEIRIDYRNDAKETVDGKEITVPFIAMTGFVAGDEDFTDITVDNGKVIDDGDKMIVVGIAAPGVTDALGIDTQKYDIDLKDSVVIKGKAKKFNIQDMMTVVTNSVFEDVDTSDIDLDFDDEVNALEDGARKLVDGSTQLYDGIDTLYGRMPELQYGIGSLKSGADSLRAGSVKLRDGSKKVLDGMVQAKSGVDTMKAGLDGKGTKTDPGAVLALGQVSAGLKAGSDTLRAKAQQMKQAEQAAAGVAQYMDTIAPLVEQYGPQLSAMGFTELVEKTPQVKAAADQLNSGLAGSSDQLLAAADKLYSAKDPTSAAVAVSRVASGLEDLSGGLGRLSASLGSYDPDLGQDQTTLIGAQTLLYNGGVSLSGGAGQLASGMRELKKSSGTLAGGVRKLDRGALELNRGMSRFYRDGIKELVNMYRNDLKGSVDSLSDMMEAGREYRTFTSLPKDMEGSVKFIYKTTIYQ